MALSAFLINSSRFLIVGSDKNIFLILQSQLSIVNYQLLSDLPLLLPALSEIDVYYKADTDV